MSGIFLCSRCGAACPSDQGIRMDEETLCPSCAETHTLLCSDCGIRIWAEENAGTSDVPLCPVCFERDYAYCDNCGELISLTDSPNPSDDVPLCSHCRERLRKHAINDYFYKPEPIFYGGGPRFFGVELEIDGAGEDPEHAEQILTLANRNGLEHIYCKHDGSLDDGFEIVTHPMSLSYHLEEMPWKAILAKAVSLGYTSHQAGTCGLHIHINRNTFGDTEEQQDTCIARILYFFERHWEELLKFSRRTQRQLDRWAARYGYRDRPMDILDHAKKGGGGGRYSSVNLQNSDTIEFRIFRGTLKYNTLIAALQMADHICDAALFLSDEELKALSWSDFVSGCRQPELVEYLKERRLYINEPVETGVEI